MIIKKVKLAPFGVMSDREFALEEGLNVLRGPNEAGKSTLINSIFAALFIPSAVKKNTEDWRGFLKNYLPHPDGDTIRVELDLLAEDGTEAKYLCAWGEGGEERLILSNGSEINNTASISEHISELLQFGRGTYQSILFARQEEMNKTIDLLRENREAGETVSGFLRAAVFESGGVSLEKFEAAAEREYERLLDNWDWDADGPRGCRGINNQHKRMVGDILRAYYDFESLRRSLRNIRSTEERISDLNKQLDTAELEQKDLEERLGKYEMLENDARKRSTLEPKLDAIYKEEKQVKEVADQWPRVQERVANIEKDIQVKEQAKIKLEESLKEAQVELENQQTRKLFDQVEPLKKDLEKKQAELKALKKVSGEDVSTLEDYLRQEEKLKGIAGAMKLKAALTVKKPLSVKVTSGLEEPCKQNIENEELFYGDGRLLLETEDWAIDIQSGQQDVSKLLSDAKAYRNKFNALLAKLEFEDLEAAKEFAANRVKLEGSMNSIENKLEGQLGSRDYAELESSVKALGPEKAIQEPGMINTEINELVQDLAKIQANLEYDQQQLKLWEEEYDSTDEVYTRIGQIRQQISEIKTELSSLAAVPEEYDTPDQLIDDLKEMRDLRSQVQKNIFQLKQELLEIQMDLPEQSTEDLEVELTLAEERMKKLKREGRAIQKVRKEFADLKEKIDADTFSPLIDKFGQYLAIATIDRYRLASMKDSLPHEILTPEGKALPLELLSAGTTSGVAIALRLAMASYLLQDKSGFMVMDDPLVHLDPQRRKSVAGLVRYFASEKQTILTTCDPHTAELIGGNLIEV